MALRRQIPDMGNTPLEPVIKKAPVVEQPSVDGTVEAPVVKDVITVEVEDTTEGSVIGNILIVEGDVIEKYPWGITSKSQIKINEVPSMILTEFEPNNGAMLEALTYLDANVTAGYDLGIGAAKVAGGQMQKAELKALSRADAYVKMYSGTPTGNVFILPYFDPYNHAIQTEWKEFEMPKVAGEMGKKILSGVQKAANVAATVAAGASNQYATLSKRLVYGGIAPANVTTTFHLFNTLSDNALTTIFNNLQLVRALISNNLPDKTSVFTLAPPVIYTLEIPGVRYAPAAFASTVQVSNVGQVNRINFGDGINYNIPDAWEITIQLTEMLQETRNIYEGAFSGKDGPKVTVIEE